MVINSKFKDYYDYIAGLYCGGDPRVLYLRHPIKDVSVDEKLLNKVSHLPNHYVPFANYKNIKLHYDFKWLVITGKYYLLLRKNEHHQQFSCLENETYHVLSAELHQDVYEELMVKKTFWGRAEEVYDYEYYIGRSSQKLVDLSKNIKAPVFTITVLSRDSMIIEERVPVLNSLGVPSIINAQQMYQNIAYFLSNVMVESADTKPPVNVSDMDLIRAKGFDLKQSFRHRK